MNIEEYIYRVLLEIREHDPDLAYGLFEDLEGLEDRQLLERIKNHIDAQGGL